MAEVPLFRAVEGKDVTIEWKPFELRPWPAQTLSPFSDYIQKAWNGSILPLADQLQVTMHLNETDPQPHTHLAHEGLLAAKEHGLDNEYAHRIFEAFYVEGKDIGHVDVLTEEAVRIGLPADEFRQALEHRRFQEARQAALEEAAAHGIRAVPAFQIGDRWFTGLQPEHVLEEAVEEAAADAE
ncbi:DsbA family oxidoreductase [Alkalicoccus chagannorensis]|uniref:DsbA family oxidoreductase n=1 Tax=Alkalicoccus chagannorensis TaxID=427072 RepID=UPI000417EFB9|nr:DsbA family protein [Alkalicoccus chagannorensis]